MRVLFAQVKPQVVINCIGLIKQLAGASAGSLFVFKGSYRAVLINYPTVSERDSLIGGALKPA